ncbi:predicted protein [Pyrenophora tritici-repentis Pt-1C-BFP]|uniref:Uncharacterized protein n=1 Tax=Pyrenophora tritici-repentis (strain Pt-1C-BFP) TaxID=426418 RepID=B2WG48_PYRTR|nr:uncharacterized protein PTRG_08904 [Pyrenophora tritici-repentis Pt-1C-BFP]EDU41955.1 predicted protein [Pyrenophora tritici-repentis Pt-1C-BFP]
MLNTDAVNGDVAMHQAVESCADHCSTSSRPFPLHTISSGAAVFTPPCHPLQLVTSSIEAKPLQVREEPMQRL